jgi:hypothetical protein
MTKVLWSFVFQCMFQIGILQSFIDMVTLLFQNVKVVVNLNPSLEVSKAKWAFTCF